MRISAMTACSFLSLFFMQSAFPAEAVPDVVQMPGTQPTEISNLESPDKCDNCHGGYNSAVEPAYNWRGSMMANAGRDPIFWATLAVAEQDFDGAGDLCLRCHSTGGWLAGRSTPTDGSGLAPGDSDGVECDYCHKLTNPDNSEHLGVMFEPFIANDGNKPASGYYGSGMSSMWGGSDKLGPYGNADARHQFMRSGFHRKPEFCGTCHDVSNPVVGELAPNHGAFINPPQTTDVAFNNFPYQYGIVERTFSEHMSSALPTTAVDDFAQLPGGGAFQAVHDATYDSSRGTADYEDGTERTYTCQTCHLRAVTGAGANKRGLLVRSDLPLHDMTGGNYLMPELIKYLDNQGKLRLGGGLSPTQRQALDDGKLRAQEQLQLAATLEVSGDDLTITNHTGHKLITGYPEGRRMWLNIKWFDGQGKLVDEVGAYGLLDVMDPRNPNGPTIQVPTITDLQGSENYIYEAHMGITQDWARDLVTLNPALYSGMPLGYDRVTGESVMTLGDYWADPDADTPHESFHFALNNTVTRDSRIPPWKMDATKAANRNVSVDARYGPDVGNYYRNYDTINLYRAGAATATIDLLYEPTSWEYVQFLYLANQRANAFLAEEGANMLEAWLWAVDNGLAEPFVLASAAWPAGLQTCPIAAPSLENPVADDKAVLLSWSASTGATSYRLYYDQADKAQLVAALNCSDGPCTDYTDSGLTNGQEYCYKVTASDGDCESDFSGILCATPQNPGQAATDEAGARFDDLHPIGIYETTKGKNATAVWSDTETFNAGDEVIMNLNVENSAGSALAGATVTVTISGPENTTLTSTTSGGDGAVEVRWSTQAPNRKSTGGTAAGSYIATVMGVSANGYSWDGSRATLTFTVN